MQKITPHLWYDKEVEEAAEFYVSVFPASRIKSKVIVRNTPSDSVDIVNFELMGLEFQAIGAGPLFKFNPSISFFVICTEKEEVDRMWNSLSQGGQVLMELGEYPFSERFGWLQDRYGLSWQLIYSGEPQARPMISPFVMFVGEVCGRAEEAINFWISVVRDGNINNIMHYGKGEEPDKEGNVKLASFSLFGQEFRALDSAYEHQFQFNEAISFIVNCETQKEIDYFWRALSADPDAEACGWLKDKFGVSWQIVPTGLEEMMSGDDLQKIDRMTQALLAMKKLDIAKLREAYDGE
jgi:predicted 3-demethylubiquinone-9 3-methyltransferase (glyoxalase superfamily)